MSTQTLSVTSVPCLHRKAFSKGVGAGCLLLLFFSISAFADTHYVSLSGSHTAPFADWLTAATNIQAAIDVASDGDTVLVTNGVYATGGRVVYGALSNRVAITKSLTVRSVNGPTMTIIQGAGPVGDSAVRCAYVGMNAVVVGFTLTNGATRSSGDDGRQQYGGGVWCEGSGVLSNCVLTGNSASSGGGAYDGTLYNCTLSGNTATYAGGGAANGMLSHCTLSGNSVPPPSAGASGGGGGAAGCTLNNCLLTGNSAVGGGGVSDSTLNNCTLAGNSATLGGGAYWGTLYNCIVYYNTASSDSNYYGCTLTYSCTTPDPGGIGNITNDPLFVNAAAGDYHLQSTSLCINAGTNQEWMIGATDLDGNSRLYAGGRVDMGAYEYQGPIMSMIAVTPVDPSILIGTSQQFTAIANYTDGSPQDVTTQAMWTSSDTGVATINTNGLATGISTGVTIISATLSGVVGFTTVAVNMPVVITTTSLLAGALNAAYTKTLKAAGGTLPYDWSLASGSLPPGLTLSGETISGTPTATGTFNFVVQVTDAGNPMQTATQSLSIAIAPSVSITTIFLPNGVINVAYTGTLTASGGTLPYTWSLASGSLPSGLTLSGGAISGTPTATGTFNFVVQVSDAGNPMQTATQSLSIAIAPSVSITTIFLPNGVINVAYTGTLTASGGTLPYTWSLASGSLPRGLTLDGGTIAGTPTTTGTFNFVARVTDAGNPRQTTTKSLSIMIVPLSTVATIWPSNAVPVRVDDGDENAVELGVKFKSDVAGTITGIRFYKAVANTGTHIGNLWTSSGTLLGTATFANETTSGWQQVLFATPVPITSNTVYVASYHANNGHYSADLNYFKKGVDNPPLHALANGVSGGNGVYAYGLNSAFPNQTWNAANYWVDVVFRAGPPLILTSIVVTPTNSSIITGVSTQFTATGIYSDGNTQDLTRQVTWTSLNTVVATINTNGLATGVSTGMTTISATLTNVVGSTKLTVQSAPLSITTTLLTNGVVNMPYTETLMAIGGTLPYTWSISNGSLPSGLTLNAFSGVITGTPTITGTNRFTAQARDTGNPAQTANSVLSITIAPSPAVVTIWPSNAVPVRVDDGPDSAVELGVKFKSDVAGTITGIRFYKAAANTGTHIGNLWTSNGTLLVAATFTDETESGWQQVLFATPVRITNNTVYVASYHANNGHYSADANYFSGKGVDNPPLHALANGVSGGNGVYAYGSSSAFPNQTWNAANYWVDVLFRAGPPLILTSIVVTPTNSSMITGVSTQFVATGIYSDGSTRDLTSQMTWTSSNTGVAIINTNGLATGVSTGVTTISAALMNVVGSTILTVQSAPLFIATKSLPNGFVNMSYAATLKANGGILPYTWSISNGSLPSGLTLNAVSGLITGTPTDTGTVSFTAYVRDASNPAQTASNVLSITIAPSPPWVTIWPSNAVPGRVDDGPSSPVELGVKFRSDVNGAIAGIRFYKAKANTGIHMGNLWTSNGILLAAATFTNETDVGWQQAVFATPVTIASNTVYVASYHSKNGHYSEDDYYFQGKGVDNPPLHALANGVSGGNGVYAYGSSSAFPNQTWKAANYWVDVVFQPEPIALMSIAITPTSPSILIGATQQFTAMGTLSDGSTQNLTTHVAWTSSNAEVAMINASGLATGVSTGTTTLSASLAGVTGNSVLTVKPMPLSITTISLTNGVVNVPYTVTLTANGGTLPYMWSIADGSLPAGLTLSAAAGTITGMPSTPGTFSFIVQVSDANNQTATITLNIIIIPSVPPAVTIWPSNAVPGQVDGGPDSSLELGVKFRSDVDGIITGIRFYKAVANIGTHIGNLWTSNGTLLAAATFTNEITSGWQQALFATPVAIASNTVYVASYHTHSGHYSADLNYFSGKGVDNPPLHALTDGVSGGNGVYAYGSSSVFPNQTYNAANYWVDVVFRAGPPPTLSSLVVVPANPTIIPGDLQEFQATGVYSDGSARDVTSQTAWLSSDTTVARMITNSVVVGVSTGTTTISATLTNVVGSTTLTVQSAPLSLTTTSLTNGMVNRPYAVTLMAKGGTLPYTWSIVDGSLPLGLTLNTASGLITGTPITTGTVYFVAQVSDAGSPTQTVTGPLSITIAPLPAVVTIWPNTAVPTIVDGGPDNPLELGVKFRSDIDGSIIGIRFYKATANIGAHIGNLWTSNGTLLTTATFTNETAWGWQQTYFATPVAIASDTVYVASYHVNNGHYSADLRYFSEKGVANPPLHALMNGASGGNGVYAYGANSVFPNQTYNAANYWVDVMFRAGPPPTLRSIVVTPTNLSIIPGVSQQFTATGTYSDDSIQDLTSQATWTSSDREVVTIDAGGLATGISPGATTISAALTNLVDSTTLTVQSAPLSIKTASLPNGGVNMSYTATLTANGGTLPYTWSIAEGSLPVGLTLNAAKGAIIGMPTTMGDFEFVAQVCVASNPLQTVTKSLRINITPAGPILVVTNTANPFSQYYAEILLTEGLNEFDLKDISFVSNETLLAPYDVVILGQVALQPSQVSIVSNWVNTGGNLIAMRPDKKLAGLFGLVDTGATMADRYLLVNTSTGPGAGIVGETIQFHGTADCYTVASETHIVSLATLYSNVQTATLHPAVTLRSVGSNGGQAAAFTYDLARSIVYTRQGNPAWAGQERDGDRDKVVRSDDLFYGAKTNDLQPDWIDLTNNKVAIPQADEQQRLLANLILTMNSDKNLLPRFWYFPHGYEAVVVMTEDDHRGNVASRFDQHNAFSPTNGSVADWETIRSTAYMFTNATLINAQASNYNAVGFEIGLHLNTLCANYTRESLHVYFAEQLVQFSAIYPSVPLPKTLRAHCIPWSGYTTMPEVEVLYGIRLDLNYYYYPSNWVADRPGFFTGSAMPMRFATATGDVIDVYQAATEMTDESGQSYPYTVDSLLDRALGPEGYYGAFVANAHTISESVRESDAIIWSAKDREVPVISACQLLTWLDARNASSLKAIRWNDNRQTFSVNADTNARGLLAMAPVPDGYSVREIEGNGDSIGYYLRGVKGFQYAMFPVTNGDYEVSYGLDTNSPNIMEIMPTHGQSGVGLNTKVSVTFSEAMNASTINTNTITLRDSSSDPVAATVSYNAASFTAVLTPRDSLVPLANYTAVVKGNTSGVTDVAGNPRASDFVWAFTTVDGFSIWPATAVPRRVDDGPSIALEVGVKFQSDVAGTITGIRFYKSVSNTGTHVGNLWSSAGARLATATFVNETASGWQKALFTPPVAIASNTVYVASYHADNGHYSEDDDYFGKDVYNPPLHALANGVSSNGVYAYGSSSIFPNQSWSAANYWVDVVFLPESRPFPPAQMSNEVMAVGASSLDTETSVADENGEQ